MNLLLFFGKRLHRGKQREDNIKRRETTKHGEAQFIMFCTRIISLFFFFLALVELTPPTTDGEKDNEKKNQQEGREVDCTLDCNCFE